MRSGFLGGNWLGRSAFGGGGAAAGNGLLNNLIYFYALNEAAGANNALDLHSNALHLTQNSSPGADTGKVYATARTFDGSADYFGRASEALLQTGDVDWTIAAWVYLANTGDRPIIAKETDSITREYRFFHSNAGNGYRLLGFQSGGAIAYSATTAPATTNQWQFVIAWYSAVAQKAYISLDGGATVEAARTAAPTTTSSPTQIGAAQLSGTPLYFSGRIGPVAMWKSAAGGGGVLSEAQRAALYNGGAGLPYASYTT